MRLGIVQNPDKLRDVFLILSKAITGMSENVTSNKSQIAELDLKARKLQIKIDIMKTVEQVRNYLQLIFIKDIITSLKIMQECDSERKLLAEENQKGLKIRDSVENKQSELRELGIKEQVISLIKSNQKDN